MIWFAIGFLVGCGVGIAGTLRWVRRRAQAFCKAWDDSVGAILRVAEEEQKARESVYQRARKAEAERRGNYGAN